MEMMLHPNAANGNGNNNNNNANLSARAGMQHGEHNLSFVGNNNARQNGSYRSLDPARERFLMPDASNNNNNNNNNSNMNLSVRAGMRQCEHNLSFIGTGAPNMSHEERQQRKWSDEKRRKKNQGACCWRLYTSRGLRYRICTDLMCTATILPGSAAVIFFAANYIMGVASPKEPYNWLKYVVLILGCFLLLVYVVWICTAFNVYCKAIRRRRTASWSGNSTDNADNSNEDLEPAV